MDNKPLVLDTDKKQSLEAWVNETIFPILSAIGAISKALEELYQEIS